MGMAKMTRKEYLVLEDKWKENFGVENPHFNFSGTKFSLCSPFELKKKLYWVGENLLKIIL